MKRKLTDRYVKSLKPAAPGRRPLIWDANLPGFAIRSTDKGHHSYGIWTRIGGGGNPTWRAIGDVRSISLADAREKARQWIALADKGKDPRAEEERRRRIEIEKRANTFSAVAEAFIAEKVATERKAREVERDIRRNLISRWGDWPVSDITDLEVWNVVKAKAKTAPAQARNLFGTIKRLFRWAAQPVRRKEFGLVASPCAELKPSDLLGAKSSDDRTLSDEEVFALWRAAERMLYPYGPVYRLLVLTALRLNEVADASWSEFDLHNRRWEIPASRMKGKNGRARAHVVPLTDEVMAILNILPRFARGKFVFSTTFGELPVWIGSKVKRRLDERMLRTLRALARRRGEDPTAVTLTPWKNHHIRRTVRTNLSALKIPEEVREAVLAHVRPGIKGTYDKHDYLDEKREALELWAARLRSIVEPAPPDQPLPDNVVRMHKAVAS